MDTTNFATFKERFPLPEITVARSLGLNRDEIREIRGNLLKKGEDWELVKNRVCYSRDAVETIRAGLGVKASEPAKKPQDGGNAAAPEEILEELVECITLRTRNNNKRILVAHLAAVGPHPDNWVYVRVRDSSRYRPQMRLQCRLVKGKVYVHVGRIPRTTIV